MRWRIVAVPLRMRLLILDCLFFVQPEGGVFTLDSIAVCFVQQKKKEICSNAQYNHSKKFCFHQTLDHF